MTILADPDRDALLAQFGERVRFDEPLAAYTSWRVGGPADAFVTVESADDVRMVLRLCTRRRLPWFVLGSGSNLLVGDGGMRGIVMRLAGAFSAIDVRAENGEVAVRAGGAVSMAQMTAKAASEGAVGIGSLAGVPGSVGGSLRMNAGTDREVGDFVREVWIQTPSRPEPYVVPLQYFYRHTTLARDALVTQVAFAFPQGDPREVRAEMQQRLVRRKETQPLQFPNAGSCFRNPPGDKAGRLIEAAGAKGWRVGGAEVSTLHANFVVNVAEASALDITTLLARVRRAVRDQFGVELQLEVHLVGEFIDQRGSR